MLRSKSQMQSSLLATAVMQMDVQEQALAITGRDCHAVLPSYAQHQQHVPRNPRVTMLV
jgi:hypothetical protein